MTRAFASVANKGVAVTPYAIRKVVTADGRLLYQHEADEERVLVAPWVAAEMTDLLQSAVLSGTGRAAQIGRPVAGKTGTTTSNKDGWFIGFSSGLTTGVWMGRDDAGPVAGLQGGTAPARAFHDFMSVAVANRPVEQFETQVPMPDWQLTPEEEVFGDAEIDANCDAPMVDENGMPICSAAGRAGLPRSTAADGQARRTGEPSQQGLDQALPAAAAAAAASISAAAAAAAPAPHQPPITAADRPVGAAALRRIAPPSPRPAPGPNSRASSALNSGPWLRWTRCATSCATT